MCALQLTIASGVNRRKVLEWRAQDQAGAMHFVWGQTRYGARLLRFRHVMRPGVEQFGCGPQYNDKIHQKP